MSLDLAKFEKGLRAADYETDLTELQERLAQILVAHIVRKKRALIVFEGWDAAGKGGAIQRLTAEWDPRAFSVWPIAAPSVEERSRHFLWRFWTKLPAAGEIAVFDRSWYGRVLVERVEGFATRDEWRRAFEEINQFEAQQIADGTTIVKLFLHVTQEVQDERLKARLDHPWKRWKVGPDDFRNRARRADYLKAIAEMFDRTSTAEARWTIIDGNRKKGARLAVLKATADALEASCPMSPPPASEETMRLAREAFGKGN